MASSVASILAGSLAGAVGVGISYPFDTLSTKAQVDAEKGASQLSTVTNIRRIWSESGIEGFFQGVSVTMLGQALIKAVLFYTNEVSRIWLDKNTAMSAVVKMTLAGIMAGLISSFVVSPIELLKIRMQAQGKKSAEKKDDDAVEYNNELDCAQQIVKEEGWRILLTHGLWITIIREIPSFAFYFVAYGLLSGSSIAAYLGPHLAPLVNGALAGWAMWIPTYPIDIVKTIRQNQQHRKGGTNRQQPNLRQITAKIYRNGGARAFFDGLEPKLARAAVKHAFTFWMYEVVINFIRPGK